MSRVCEVTGKRPMVGNNVSHANNKTKRRFLPNLQYRRFWVESENRFVRLRVTNAALRLIDKKGIDVVLADLRKRGDDLAVACHRALISSVVETVRQATDHARRAAHLKAVAPKLRAKGAGEAVEMFLTRDAVAPSGRTSGIRASRAWSSCSCWWCRSGRYRPWIPA